MSLWYTFALFLLCVQQSFHVLSLECPNPLDDDPMSAVITNKHTCSSRADLWHDTTLTLALTPPPPILRAESSPRALQCDNCVAASNGRCKWCWTR